MISPEQVSRTIAKARQLVEEHAPAPVAPAAHVVLDKLEERRGDVAKLGELGAVQALSWWASINPFVDPPEPGPGGYAAGRAEIQGAGDRLQADRDQELEALRRLKELALDVGRVALVQVVPYMLQAIRR